VVRDGVIEVRAPMVGSVADILVQPGAQVTEDDEVLILESMKIQIPIRTPGAGTVREIRVSIGDAVQEDDLLMVLS
jgi:acetyl-CoA carboxylase biotin carboxyl carrier protein